MPQPTATLPDLHQRRVLRMLMVGSGITMVSAGLWAVILAVQGNWPVVALHLSTVVLGAATAVLTRRGQVRLATS